MMKKINNTDKFQEEIVISGIGMITALGNEAEEVWRKLDNGRFEPQIGNGAELIFEVTLSPGKLRRISRYSKLAVGGALYALKDAGIEVINGTMQDRIPEFRRGVIFTTGYGAMVSNVQFCESVANDEPDLCSPALFASTVPNSCVGQVCMQLNFKGSSTVLVGGNALFYSKMLLQNNKADIMIAGAVEEYSKDLFDSLGKNKFAANIHLRESTVVFALEKRKNIKKEAYCVIENSSAGSFDAYPLIKEIDSSRAREAIACTVKKCVEDIRGDGIGVIISSSNGGYFDGIEQQVLAEALPDVPIITEIKKYFGETMGSSFGINIAVAAMCLQKNKIPAVLAHDIQIERFDKILVTGYDTIGNYHCLVLGK